jgi:hypothetical protein
MKHSRKYIPLLLALVHLCASTGFAGIEHLCQLTTHATPDRAQCCCTAEEGADEGDSCSGDSLPLHSDVEGPSFALKACCEFISHYHQVEETSPSTPSTPILAAGMTHLLLPPKNDSTRLNESHAIGRLVLRQCNLPLLI